MIESMLVLSTAHLTPKTCTRFLDQWNGPAYEKGDYGWFVYAIEESDTLPCDLAQCIEYAIENKCFWIMFDRDAQPIQQLKTYDW